MRSWEDTRKYLLLTAAMLAGAVALFMHGQEIWAGIMALLGAIAFLGGLTFRVGPCPFCDTQMRVSRGPNWCAHCHDYVFLERKRLSRMKPGWISKEPSFVLPTGLLKVPSQWKWPSPGMCCVCGASAKKTEKISWTANLLSYSFEAAHCDKHKKGLACEAEVLKFRSYDVLQAFKRMNAEAQGWESEGSQSLFWENINRLMERK
jgi:hypothetical protein